MEYSLRTTTVVRIFKTSKFSNSIRRATTRNCRSMKPSNLICLTILVPLLRTIASTQSTWDLSSLVGTGKLLHTRYPNMVIRPWTKVGDVANHHPFFPSFGQTLVKESTFPFFGHNYSFFSLLR